MESLQELLDKNDYETVIKKFASVKVKLDKYYYHWKFVNELQRFVLETMDFDEGEDDDVDEI